MTPVSFDKIAKDKQYKILIIAIVVIVVGILLFVIIKVAKTGGSFLDIFSNIFKGFSSGAKSITDNLGLTTSDTQKQADAEKVNPRSPWNENYLDTVPSQVLFSVGAQQDYETLAYNIWDSLGIAFDDSDRIIAQFNLLRTKAQLAQLVIVFRANYNKDLLEYLRTGGGSMPWDGLSDKHLQQIMDYVKNLPNY